MGWTLFGYESTKTNGYAQDGNLKLMNHHPPLLHQPFLNDTKTVHLAFESVFSFPRPPTKPQFPTTQFLPQICAPT